LIFAGFRSRWTIPFSCAASSASAIFVERNGAAGEPLGERRSFHQFEHQRAAGVDRFHGVDRGDVRMVERGEHAGFAFEAREPVRIAEERGGQHLDRDLAPEMRVAGAVHLAHASGAQQAQDRVRTEGVTGR
jgi:hypothetical protein